MESEYRLTDLVEAAGCAAKIPPGALAQVLGDLHPVPNKHLLVGYDTSDDACAYQLPDGRILLQTLDFFPPMVDDPYLFGQIAATNALSDIYAMGGIPELALNILAFPHCLGLELAGEILRGAADIAEKAHVSIVGGHSINDREPKYGMSVTGFCNHDELLSNAGSCVGDVLMLTKPLGSGIMMTAHKADMVSDDLLEPVFRAMTTLNNVLVGAPCRQDIHALTDVTGFSLLGHATEMAEGSDVTLEIHLAQLPVFEGALDCARLGLIPAGCYANRQHFKAKIAGLDQCDRAVSDVAFDPQTSGGLLISVASDKVSELKAYIEAQGLSAYEIGRVISRNEAAVTLM